MALEGTSKTPPTLLSSSPNMRYWQTAGKTSHTGNQMQFTVGGNRINYSSKVATPTAEMLVAKMLFNSIISTKNARFMIMDISNFYLMTPLHRAKFIWIKLSNIPNEVIREYKLRDKSTKNGSIYIRAKCGMYSLPQAGLLANKLLEKRLNKHKYWQSKLVPGLWKQDTRPIQFTLVVDNFWHQIHWQRTCATSQECTQKTLQTHMQLDRQTIHQDNIGLGLQQVPCPSIHAKLHAQSFETISTQSRQTPACTIPKYTNTIWRKETICNTRIGDATIRQQSQEVHSTGMREVLIPW